MNENVKQKLFEKNARIIEAVKRRAEIVCPGALDMIAVTGSFASGDFHEKSDLDLLIVIGDERGYELSHCFILDDVGYDLYCHTWERLEHAAEYDSPFVSKLLDAKIVYCREDAVRARFDAIAGKLQQKLHAPLSEQDISHAEEYLKRAKEAYFDLVSCGGGGYDHPLIGVVYALECAVYILNHAVVRHGVRGVCAELTAMKMLPDGFLLLHASLFGDHSYGEAKTTAMTLIQNTARLIAECKNTVSPKQTLCADNLRGSYEELFSNYRNKLVYAAVHDDPYLSRMTLASAQLFFDEVGEAVDIDAPGPFDCTAYKDPVSAQRAFDDAMSRFEKNYARAGLSVCRYASVMAFEDAYIDRKTE
ncbi:MAG: nucleotidyltransferase domain-containing protein [Clostridia bacterium]|nr:nucleotidyltransferase domain-containing protein [Clostridia bacterium]